MADCNSMRKALDTEASSWANWRPFARQAASPDGSRAALRLIALHAHGIDHLGLGGSSPETRSMPSSAIERPIEPRLASQPMTARTATDFSEPAMMLQPQMRLDRRKDEEWKRHLKGTSFAPKWSDGKNRAPFQIAPAHNNLRRRTTVKDRLDPVPNSWAWFESYHSVKT